MLHTAIYVRELADIPNVRDTELFLPAHCFDADGNTVGYEMVLYLRKKGDIKTYIIPRKTFSELKDLFHEMTAMFDPKKTRGYTNCIKKIALR